MIVRWIQLLLLTAVLASGASCVRMLRQPVTGPRSPGETDAILMRRLDPFLLTGLVTRKVVVEVDWVEGCEPAKKALAGAERFLRRYVPSSIDIVFEKDDTIPRKEWERALKEDRYERTDKIVEAHIDHPPDQVEGVESIYVLYTPRSSVKRRWSGDLGEATVWTIHRAGRTLLVHGVEVHKETIQRVGVLWITDDRVERNVLIHEMGHELGAVANPRHEWRDNPGHCANPNCCMTYATGRAILYNFPRAFFTAHLPMNLCRECRADVTRAQALWRERSARDPSFAASLQARKEAERLAAEASELDDTGNRQGAIAKYREALERSPNDSWLYSRLGEVLHEEGQHDEAMEAYRTAIRSDSDPRLIFALGDLFCDRGRYADALDLVGDDDIEKNLDRDPNSAFQLFLLRARALRGTGRTGEVISLWERCARAKRIGGYYHSSAIWNVAQSFRLEGRLEEALRAYDRIPKNRRESFWYKMDLARLELARGRREAAAKWLADADSMVEAEIEKYPGRAPQLWCVRAVVLALAGKSEDVQTLLKNPPHQERDEAPLNDWEKTMIVWARARSLAILGDREDALEALHGIGEASVSYSNDPCLDEDLASLRTDARFHEMFPWCPAQNR